MKKSITSFASIALLLYPFLDYYGYGFLSLGLLLALIYIIFTIKVKGKLTLAFQIPMLLYMFYFCLTRIFYATSIRESFAPSILFIFIFWGVLNVDLSLNSFLKWYRRIAYVNICFFILQECMFQVLGYRLLGILTFLPLTLGDADFDAVGWGEASAVYARSSAFFSEPAHFVQFMLPLLILELFYSTDKNAKSRCILYVIVLIASSSGNALAGLLVIGLFYVSRFIKRTNILLITCIVTFFVIFLPFAFTKLTTTEYGEKMIERQEELNPEQSTVSSGFIRIFRGYYIWDVMTLKEKIFGVNSTTRIKDKIEQCEVYFTFEENDVYMNCVQTVMVQTGVVGCVLFVFSLISLWRGNNFVGHCCIVVFIILSFIASIYFSVNNMLLLLISAYLMKKENDSSLGFLYYFSIPFKLTSNIADKKRVV